MSHALSQFDLSELAAFRRRLHRSPEISGVERQTAELIASTLDALGATRIETGLGGHGVIGFFEGAEEGPLVLLRAELDALPIPEQTGLDYTSEREGWAHLCGHDGHMTALIGVARVLSQSPPRRGRVGLLFQPAEETGQGAAAMVQDPRLADLRPAAIFAQHNLPGLPLGTVALRAGPIACASCGLKITLRGRPAHASQPETGLSPRAALSELLDALDQLNARVPIADAGFAMATITHCAMGAQAFGIAPGAADIWVTLRTLEDAKMAELRSRAEAVTRQIAHRHGLEIDLSYHDVFASTVNDPAAVDLLRDALDTCGIAHSEHGQPWRPSEDFGQFAALGPVAMMFTGAGEDHAPLHDPAYDFPDDLTPMAVRAFLSAIALTLGDDPRMALGDR